VNKKKGHGPPTAGPLDDGTLLWLDRIISPASGSRRPLSEVVDEYRWDIRLVLVGGKDLMRWKLMRLLLDEEGLTWDDAYWCAGRIFEDGPYKGRRDTLRKSYEKMERMLPKEKRRPRTYKRRPLG
jgi:hypothetical protein